MVNEQFIEIQDLNKKIEQWCNDNDSLPEHLLDALEEALNRAMISGYKPLLDDFKGAVVDFRRVACS